MSLAARRHATHIELEWNVTGAKGNICFEIEKSADAAAFVKRAVIYSGNTGVQNTYRWIDPEVATYNYYRVKAIDEQGRVIYSRVLLFKKDEAITGAKVYPNPVKNREINIVFRGYLGNTCQLKILDSRGATVLNRTLAFPRNENGTSIHFPASLSAGIYIIIGYNRQGVLFRQQVLID